MFASRRALGWIAAGMSAVITSFWAFWGIIENFHEGWYDYTLTGNIGLMLIQYLSPMLLFLILAAVAHAFPRIGGIAHIVVGVAVVTLVVNTPAARFFILTPMVLLGAFYYSSDPIPRRWMILLNIFLPLVVLLVFGARPAYTVIGRFDDGFRGERSVEGNGVLLSWAPAGPGWAEHGVTWIEARDRCRRLRKDGTGLSDSILDLWRLPTVDEAVRSLTRNGRNAGGIWNPQLRKATYALTPDKETPLWNPHSMIVYWWTSTETDSVHAYRIAYNGQIHPMMKRMAMGSMGFRAVRSSSRPPVEAQVKSIR